MEDKRSTQLVLPLGLTYEPKHKDLVKQHWNVTFARQGRMSVTAKRIMTRGRKKITGFKFTLKRKQDGKIPEYWLQNTVVSKVVAGLRAWKVTDKNIALYLEDIGTKAANKLLYDWQLKENTDDRINDRVKYCNAVFVRMGKAAQERLKQEVQAALR